MLKEKSHFGGECIRYTEFGLNGGVGVGKLHIKPESFRFSFTSGDKQFVSSEVQSVNVLYRQVCGRTEYGNFSLLMQDSAGLYALPNGNVVVNYHKGILMTDNRVGSYGDEVEIEIAVDPTDNAVCLIYLTIKEQTYIVKPNLGYQYSVKRLLGEDNMEHKYVVLDFYSQSCNAYSIAITE